MDCNILAALADRRRFKSLRDAVPEEMVTSETKTMLAWYGAYFNAFPEATRIDVDEMESFIRLRSSKATPEQLAVTLHLNSQLRKPVPESTIQGLVGQLYELDFAGRAGALIARYNDSEEIELSYELMMLAASVRKAISSGGKANWEDGDILDSLEGDSDEGGLRWTTFKELDSTLKGLQKGDNVAVCAPTDMGKSSLLCRLGVDLQIQAKDLYPGQPLLYLVNEGLAKKIKNRLYQTATGLQRDKMLEHARAGTLEKMFSDVVGSRDAIRVANIHGKNVSQVAQLIEQHSPHTVITDMTGRIRANSNKGGGMNDIGQLEEVWDEMRQLAAIQNFAHIGTVQVSAEGFDNLFPPVSALQNSKTGIQTTLDLIIMMGALRNPQFQFLRGISTPKNKLARSGQNSLVQFETQFNPQINEWYK